MDMLTSLPHLTIIICFCAMFYVLYRKSGMKGFLFFFIAFCLMGLRHVNNVIINGTGMEKFISESDKYLHFGITILEVLGFIVLLVELYRMKKSQSRNPFSPTPALPEDDPQD